jgi:predicted HicB family RNase H-like nuclease
VVKKLTAVRLKEEHLAQLAEEAKRQDVSVSHLIRVAVVQFLEKLKEAEKKKR